MRLLSLLLLSISSLFAVPYTVSSSGTFGGSASTTPMTAPNQTWSFSFLIDSNPLPNSTELESTRLPISGFEYRLNGSLVPANPSGASFYPALFGGGFDIETPEVIVALGPQMFSGTLASPTILPGVYTLGLDQNSVPSRIGDASILGAQVTIGAAVPEPASVGLSLLGLVGLGLLLRRARK